MPRQEGLTCKSCELYVFMGSLMHIVTNDAVDVWVFFFCTVQGIDGVDNGINMYDTDKLPRYANDTHLSARVGRLNPDWMDEQTPAAEEEAFRKAMRLTGSEFLEVYFATKWLCYESLSLLDEFGCVQYQTCYQAVPRSARFLRALVVVIVSWMY
jgi:uncharacterized UPF0160 family protein